jgi:calcineurin-like phosphoesterase family protein
MDAEMIRRWNAVVQPQDTVYHLGDVVINRRCLQTLGLLNGSKRLILGNHDIFDHDDYLKHFKRLHGSLKLNEWLLTHIPVHADSVPHWAAANVHGHIHAQDIANPRYLNVCVEMTDYAPVPLDTLRDRLAAKAANLQHL